MPEELHRRRLGKRRERILALDRDPHRLPTRDEEAKARALARKLPKARRCLHHLLEVVQEEEAGAVADVPGDVAVGADRLGDRGKDQSRVAERRQRDEPPPSGNASAASLATASAKRVLPTPPGPVIVTARGAVEERLQDVRELLLRPTRGLAAIGRFDR